MAGAFRSRDGRFLVAEPFFDKQTKIYQVALKRDDPNGALVKPYDLSALGYLAAADGTLVSAPAWGSRAGSRSRRRPALAVAAAWFSGTATTATRNGPRCR